MEDKTVSLRFDRLRQKLDHFQENLGGTDAERTDRHLQMKTLLFELDTYRTELEMQNEQLRESQLQLEKQHEKIFDLYNFAPVGYLTLDAQGHIYELNLTFAEMVGVPKSQLLRRPFALLVHAQSQEDFYRFKQTLCCGGTPQRTELRLHLGLSPENQEHPAEERSFAERWVVVEGVASIARQEANVPLLNISISDISQLKRLEVEKQALALQLEQGRKLEAIGRLAGGIAHDFNNILQSIMGLASLLELDCPEGSPMIQDIRTILAVGDHGQALCRNLLGFARKGNYVKEQISLNLLVANHCLLLERTLPKGITLHQDFDRELDLLEGDSSQINQILSNLAINAVDALAQKGKITFRTNNLFIAKDDAAHPLGLVPGHYVRLQIIDTGKGMDTATISHLFEPFFTTKPKNRGTGFGLAMVYGAVKAHRGGIDISSTPGSGTKVSIYLPSLGSPPPLPLAAVSQQERALYHHSGGTVLLVDDEVNIRLSGKRLLEKLGFAVFLAENGHEALEVYRKEKAQICLVILDLEMPVMNGQEAFEALLKITPAVKVVVSSGYFEEQRITEMLAHGAVGFLPKPYKLNLLSQLCAQALPT
jgi:signal transduction histidine kinase